MKSAIFGLLVLIVCAGPSCLNPEPFDRLASNVDLRAACADLWLTDSDIESLLATVETMRLTGIPKAMVLDGLLGSWECDAACLKCTLAVVNQVYDYAP